MRAKLLKFLDFFRLLDEDGVLSLTNIAVIIVLVKLAIEPSLDYTAVGALLTVIGSYTFKRYTQRRKNAETVIPEDIPKAIEELKAKVTQLQIKEGFGGFEGDD